MHQLLCNMNLWNTREVDSVMFDKILRLFVAPRGRGVCSLQISGWEGG